IPIVFGAVLTLVLAPWLAWNLRSSGSLLGEGILQVYESWSPNPGSPVMRNYDPDGETLPKIDLARKIWRVFDQHREEAWVFLGGLAAAPLFFLSLLHPFRNPEAARLRWAVLSLWGGAQLAMGIFGTPEGALDPNLLHVLFLPVAAMYGLAFLSVLWSRLPLARNPFSLWRHAHLIAAIAISAMPLLAEFSGRALLGARYRNRIVQWPPYDPVALAYVGKWTREDQLIFSDVPWAVAWYADRPSVWLPMRPPQMDAISAAWTAGGTREVGGLYLTPASLDGRLSTNLTQGEFRDWARLLLRGQVSRFGSDLLSKPPASLRYWQRMSPVLDRESWFIAAAPLWQNPPVETAAE
ncbi:MAG: hypothetical protein KDM91_18755, partial [Verrucomicrobiae bacterium]|nr:hypothetical protein [Verrucomicrobiae bacterium]